VYTQALTYQLWLSFNTFKNINKKTEVQNQQRFSNSFWLNELNENLLLSFQIAFHFQRNDKARWSRALLELCWFLSIAYFWSPLWRPFTNLKILWGGRWWFFFITDPFIYFTWSHLNHCHPAEKSIISSHNRIYVNAQQYILNSKDVLPHLWSCCHSSWALNNSCRKVDIKRTDY